MVAAITLSATALPSASQLFASGCRLLISITSAVHYHVRRMVREMLIEGQRITNSF
jgi:hypothetical protein